MSYWRSDRAISAELRLRKSTCLVLPLSFFLFWFFSAAHWSRAAHAVALLMLIYILVVGVLGCWILCPQCGQQFFGRGGNWKWGAAGRCPFCGYTVGSIPSR
jgi:hypothetical protein